MLKQKILLVVIGLGLGAGVCLLWPRQPEIVEKIVEKEIKVRGEDVTKVVYRTKVVKPDGTSEERTEERTDTKTRETTHKDTDSNKVISKRPDYKVSVLVGAPVRLDVPTLTVGALVERRLAGPFSVGAWGLGNPAKGEYSAGLSLSVEF